MIQTEIPVIPVSPSSCFPFCRLLICRRFHLRRVARAAKWLFCQARTNTTFVWTKERQQTYENRRHNEHNQTVFLALLLKSFEATQWKLFWLFQRKSLLRAGGRGFCSKSMRNQKQSLIKRCFSIPAVFNPEPRLTVAFSKAPPLPWSFLSVLLTWTGGF